MANKIQVYLGVEEDSSAYVNRSDFDYIIGSSHYLCTDNRFVTIDSDPEQFAKCLAAFSGDPVRLAKAYYTDFCNYVNKRRPDIIGHFDLITKFDELGDSLFLKNPKYNALAEKAAIEAAKSGSIFEVNTGALSRGHRITPYPAPFILDEMKRLDCKLVLTSDCHDMNALTCGFADAKEYIKSHGFDTLYYLGKNGFFGEKI